MLNVANATPCSRRWAAVTRRSVQRDALLDTMPASVRGDAWACAASLAESMDFGAKDCQSAIQALFFEAATIMLSEDGESSSGSPPPAGPATASGSQWHPTPPPRVLREHSRDNTGVTPITLARTVGSAASSPTSNKVSSNTFSELGANLKGLQVWTTINAGCCCTPPQCHIRQCTHCQIINSRYVGSSRSPVPPDGAFSPARKGPD
jgi:hypothetical protein